MDRLIFEKYEGVGNDFLIAADRGRSMPYDETIVADVCDRHTGVGADGMIRLSSPTGSGAVRFELRNADGSFAETSGNGLRCAALAARRFGFTDESSFDVETAVGSRRVDIVASPRDGHATVRVAMGEMQIAEVSSPLVGFSAFHVDIGNPHLVLIGKSIDGIDISSIGPQLEHSEPGGLNVEMVAPSSDDSSGTTLALVVWERGAGLTRACGSGSCAAAGAAHLQGLGADRFVVRNPGGELVVELAGSDPRAPSAALVGAVRHIARIEIDVEELTQAFRQPAKAIA